MSEETGLTIQDLYEQLCQDLPAEAYITDNSRGFALTGIKGAYVTERLNQVFGLCGHGWCFAVKDTQIVEDIMVAHVELTWCFNHTWSQPIPATGSCRIVKGRVGDAEKGAVTDALKKAASYVGIGHLCYKGQIAPNSAGQSRPQPKSTPTKHWIDDSTVRTRFWSWAKGTLRLTEDQIHEALQVKSVKDFKGTMNMAKAALEAFAIDREET